MKNIKALNDIISLLKSKYKFYNYNENEKLGISVYGIIELIDPNEGFIWEFYEVFILINEDYPIIIPKLYLISKNIPFTYDRHIGEHGCCCMAPKTEEYLILGRNYNLIDYIEKLVIPFFACQKLYDLEGKWPYSEYSHFTNGLIEYYLEKLELDMENQIIDALMILSGKVKLGRNDKCFCESGKKFKKCHLQKMEKFNLVPKNIFKSDINEIKNKLENV